MGRREGGSKGWTSALPAVVAATSLFLWLKAKIVELSLLREPATAAAATADWGVP